MGVPAGLKQLLKKQKAVLKGKGRKKAFVMIKRDGTTGRKLHGITKKLNDRVFSKGTLPMIARRSDENLQHWGNGKNKGKLRGKTIDNQLTQLVNSTKAWKKVKHVYELTKHVFAALAMRKLVPVMAQRAVVAQASLATAADIVCYDETNNRVVIVEVKCGYPSGKTAAAEDAENKPMKMVGPLRNVYDCTLNRHLAQLAVTRELFMHDYDCIDGLNSIGIDNEIEALLLYASSDGVEIFQLTDWWKDEYRMKKLLKALE